VVNTTMVDSADLAGIHRTYIGDVERGTRNIALINMDRIAKALGLPLSRILRAMEEKNNSQ
jgi:transcriptional regulator with XRE-family HTH domain